MKVEMTVLLSAMMTVAYLEYWLVGKLDEWEMMMVLLLELTMVDWMVYWMVWILVVLRVQN